MQLDPNYFEDTSLHFYVPQPQGRREVMYYPISLGYFDCKPSYGVQRSMFSSYLLIVMLTGALAWQTRSGRGVARPGQALLLDCNAPHSYYAQGRCSFTFVHFAGAQSQAIYEEIERTGGNLIHLPDPNALNETIGEMLSCLREGQRLGASQASTMIHGMLMKLLERSGASFEGGVGHPAVDRAIAHIQANLMDRLTVEELAACTGYSPSYFSHLFAEETGLSPYQFIVRSRIENAQQLLMTTRLTVQEIAFQCGFNSVANFCYTFRKLVGTSPHAYRKRPM
ncbi:MAG: helix-turn-helix transcriptional regulator [Clostridia bacterium]|nr:helix-turn-helix transcriptional regulator [Clostridia bacterium]